MSKNQISSTGSLPEFNENIQFNEMESNAPLKKRDSSNRVSVDSIEFDISCHCVVSPNREL